MQTPLNFLAAFIVVLALIGLAAWLVRRFGGSNLGTNTNRGRMPRLAVVDAAAVDGRRRLVLVRRDNVEHLLMIGGPSDVVVELNIVRAMPARDGAPGRPGELPRAPSLADSQGWTDADNRPDDLDAVEASPEPPPPSRRSAPTFADEVRRPLPPPDRRISEPASLAPDLPTPRTDLTARSEPPSLPPRPPRPRPDAGPRGSRLAETLGRLPKGPEAAATPVSAAPSAMTTSPSTSAGDAEKELTDMAQRLEAALRRPSAPPVAAPSAEPNTAASSAPPVERPRPLASSSSAPPVTAPEPAAAPAAPPRSGFENLEDEMASLLGRPKSPT